MLISKLIKRFRILLSPQDKFRLLLVIALMITGALLEIAGIGLLMPIIALLTKPELLEQNYFLSRFADFAGTPGSVRFAVTAVTLLLAVWFIKALLSMYIIAAQRFFLYRKEKDMTSRLYSTFIAAPYTFHLQHGSAELHTMMFRVRAICEEVLMPSMMIATDAVTMIFLLGILIFFMPWVMLSSALFIIVCITVFYLPLRNLNHRWGRKEVQEEIAADKAAMQSFLGIKAIKATGTGKYFSEIYHQKIGGLLQYRARLYVLGQIPRHMIEFAAVVLALGCFAAMTLFNVPNGTILLTFSLLIAALSRILPAASRINYNFTRLRQKEAAFDSIFDALKIQPENENLDSGTKSFSLQRELEVKGLYFAYDPETTVLKDLNFKLPAKCSMAVTGTTGCGKSTLADLLIGLLKPDCGEIICDGIPISNSLSAWRQLVGYVPQHIYLLDDTIAANIAFGEDQAKADIQRIRTVLRTAQLLDFVESLPEKFDSVIGENGVRLSGGQRQRLGIARALYRSPELLILDEATSALDQDTEKAFIDALEELHGKLTMIIIAHRLSTVEKCDLHLKLGEK